MDRNKIALWLIVWRARFEDSLQANFSFVEGVQSIKTAAWGGSTNLMGRHASRVTPFLPHHDHQNWPTNTWTRNKSKTLKSGQVIIPVSGQILDKTGVNLDRISQKPSPLKLPIYLRSLGTYIFGSSSSIRSPTSCCYFFAWQVQGAFLSQDVPEMLSSTHQLSAFAHNSLRMKAGIYQTQCTTNASIWFKLYRFFRSNFDFHFAAWAFSFDASVTIHMGVSNIKKLFLFECCTCQFCDS
jgi:hypothetical protein